MTPAAYRFTLCLIAAMSLVSAKTNFFDESVAPILTARCLGCHNNELKDAGISFTERRGLLKGGSHGPTIVPGKPERSMLIHAVRQDGELKMPPGGKLSVEDIATLTDWIKHGAKWGTKPLVTP